MTDTPKISSTRYPFNSPLESGLRTLTLLSAMSPEGCDLQRLIYYDYFLVHTEDIIDVPNAPRSLHPATPYRSGEVVVRRKLIEQGCNLMLSRELLDVDYSENGIYFKASDITDAFLSYLESSYSEQLRLAAQFVVSYFSQYDDDQLSKYMAANVGRWGSEFVRESLLQEAADS